jgi:general secretion pathway protein I
MNFRFSMLDSRFGPRAEAWGRDRLRPVPKLETRNSKPARPARAFTLIEVLVALMIFAMSSLVLATAYLNVLNAYQSAERANQRIEELSFARAQLLAEPDRTKAETGAEFDSLENRHVKWTATIVSAGLPDLFTVTFVCEISDPSITGDNPKITQTFTVLRPTWSDPVENGQLKQSVQDRIAEIQGKKP